MNIQLVTKWSRDTGEGREFNHISIGFNPDHDEPAWVSEEQRKSWRNRHLGAGAR